MKAVFTLLFCFTLLTVSAQTMNLTGAWKATDGEDQYIMIISEQQFSVVVQTTSSKAYVGTFGGNWKMDQDEFVETHEFNTLQPELIGMETRSVMNTKDGKLSLKAGGKNRMYSRVDDGKPGQLAGAWLITGRMTDKGMSTITPGARKTMKILSGTRFQWIAYNSQTKEFFGTGGGTYTTENGKYTEHIEFFSRDNTRVGMNLQFDFALEEGHWRHKGLSSKGDPIDERWTRREQIKP